MQGRENILLKYLRSCVAKVTSAIRNDNSFSDHEVNHTRILIVMISFALSYLIIVARTFDLTMLDDEQTHRKNFSEQVIAKRADIIDRNGNVLAVNLTSSSVYANPNRIINSIETAKKLKSALPELNEKDLLSKLQSKKSFVWIKRNITPKEHQAVNDLGIPGVYFETSEKRAYPNGELFAHVLGYVGLDGIGLAGVEKQFDNYLRYYDHNEPKPLQLSLDMSIQGIVHEELTRTIREFNAKGAVGIVQDSQTGEILAMVSLPDFNPHTPGNASPDQLFNKATLGAYEMGSIFKVFTVAMALDNKTTNLNDVYDVSAPIKYARFTINDFRGKGGWLSVPEILMYSSNIGTAQIVLELGKDDHYKYLRSFGLLSPLEIELPEKALPAYPKLDNWSDLNTITISYGHGISVTPMHVVGVMSAMTNGGFLPRTTILKTDIDHLQDARQVISEATSKKMRKLLRLVVAQGGGRKADLPGLFVGGKSGTANKLQSGRYSNNLRLSSFLSVFPVHNPKYTVLVMIDEPHGTKETFGFATGSWVSAPASSRIMSRLAHLNAIAPEQDKIDAINEELYLPFNTKENDL